MGAHLKKHDPPRHARRGLDGECAGKTLEYGYLLDPKSSSRGGVAIAASTLWELAQLVTSGKFTIAGAVDAFLEGMATRVVVIPINPRVAMLGTRFSAPYPRDQADRLLGAKAVAEGIALVTKDRDIRNYGQVKTIW